LGNNLLFLLLFILFTGRHGNYFISSLHTLVEVRSKATQGWGWG